MKTLSSTAFDRNGHGNGHGNDYNGNSAPPMATPASAEPASLRNAWQLSAQQDDENDLRTLFSIVRRRSWLVLSVVTVAMVLVTAHTMQQPEIFRSRFRVLVEPVNADDDFSELTSILEQQNAGTSGLDYETQVQVLRSPELIEPVAEQLQKRYPDLDYFTLLENLQITRLGETKILEVSYSSTDPVQIQVVLDRLSTTYLEYSLEERQTNLRQGINFVQNQLPNLQREVDTIQDQLEDFRQQYNFVTPEIQSTQLSEQATILAEQRLELDRQLAAVTQAFASLQDQDSALGALDEAPIYVQLLAELRAVESEIAQELTRFAPTSLSIRVLEEKRANLLPLLQQEAQRVVGTKQALASNDFQALVAQSETLETAERAAMNTASQLPVLIRQYTDLQRELEVSTEALTRFRTTLETLEIKAAQTEIPWQLIEVPLKPTYPISPNIKRSLLLGFVVSAIVGLGVALLIDKLDNVYHSVDELKASMKLPVLGILPFNRSLKDSRRPVGALRRFFERISLSVGSSRRSSYYGYGGDSEAIFLEALRVLHTNLQMLSSDRPVRSILISSALPGDGKSTVCVHLAKVAIAMGQRVLIVDVDLRKPQVHARWEVPNTVGLSNLITDDLPIESAIQQLTPDGQLSVLTSGRIPPDPTKLLASQKMKQIMATVECCFDLVIYDAPPTLGLADVSLVGQSTDGLMLVTRIGKTERPALRQTIETLRLAQIPLLGVVANGAASSVLGYYGYYGPYSES